MSHPIHVPCLRVSCVHSSPRRGPSPAPPCAPMPNHTFIHFASTSYSALRFTCPLTRLRPGLGASPAPPACSVRAFERTIECIPLLDAHPSRANKRSQQQGLNAPLQLLPFFFSLATRSHKVHTLFAVVTSAVLARAAFALVHAWTRAMQRAQLSVHSGQWSVMAQVISKGWVGWGGLVVGGGHGRARWSKAEACSRDGADHRAAEPGIVVCLHISICRRAWTVQLQCQR